MAFAEETPANRQRVHLPPAEGSGNAAVHGGFFF